MINDNKQPEAQGAVDESECPHCVHGIVPMTMDRPCTHCTPTLTAAQQPVQEGACPECGSTDKVEDVNWVLVCGNHFCDSEPWKNPEYEARKREPVDTVPQSAPVGVAEALQRLIDNAATLGPASMEDALLVARYRSQALTQQPAQAAPGWKLVPVETTEAMLDAASDAEDEARRLDRSAYAHEIYAAMLAAAPTPPGDDAAGGGS